VILSYLLAYLLIYCILYRLREIITKVKNDDISKDVLVSNLEYIAKVLETTYVNETR